MVDFKDRVAIVTGGAGAIGRAYCLLLAKMGAKVVVNDLGTTVNGKSSDSSPASKLVAEIKSQGGVAVVNTNSAGDGAAIVKAAIDNFGRIDIIVHNAGFLEDKSIQKITLSAWNDIIEVHLSAAFKLAQAAWPYMVEQKYGKLLFTGSTSGLYGNFGQTNYAAAKMGLWGLVKSIALEGERHNIFANLVIPTALSRMTESLMPKEMADMFDPMAVAMVGAYLCSEDNKDNGVVVETGAGWAAKSRIQRSKGFVMPLLLSSRSMADDLVLSVESVKNNWNKIDFPQTNSSDLDYDVIVGNTDALSKIIASVEASTSMGSRNSLGDSMKQTMKQAQDHVAANVKNNIITKTNVSVPAASTSAPAPAAGGVVPLRNMPRAGPNEFEAERVFNILKDHLDEEIVKRIGAVFVFNVSKNNKTKRYLLDAKNGKGSVKDISTVLNGQEEIRPDVQLTTTDDLFLQLILKETTAQKLFMNSKLKVRGSIATAMKFEQVMRSLEHKVAGKL